MRHNSHLLILAPLMKRFFWLVLLITTSIYSSAGNKAIKNLRSLPSTDTINVEIGISLKNISSIAEVKETINIEANLYLLWKDERLIYDADSSYHFDKSQQKAYKQTPPKIYVGNYQVNENFPGWYPRIIIPNGIGNRKINEQSIEVWPNGYVKYQESFNAQVESPMDFRVLPFDEQTVNIFFHTFNYTRQEVKLVPCQNLSRIWDQDEGIAQWKRKGVDIKEQEREIKFFNGESEKVSELVYTIKIKRKPLNIIVGIILPLLILVCLTWCVFWMDKESVSNRVNITFIGILSVVAYYLVIQDRLPKISYITILDLFILLTFGILAATVVVSLVIEKLNQDGKEEQGDRLDQLCKWIFPLSYFSGIFLIIFVFKSLYS